MEQQDPSVPTPHPSEGEDAPKGRERRTRRRWLVDSNSRLHHRLSFSHSDRQARVVDFNSTGARIETQRPLETGEWVTVQVPRFRAGHLPEGMDAADIPYIQVRGRVLNKVYTADSGLGGFAYGVKFARDGKTWLRFALSRLVPWLALAAIVAGALAVGMLKTANLKYFWYHPIFNTYGLLVSGYILSRFGLAVFYRPPIVHRDYQPSVTVIIVCKNEEDSIYRTLEKIYESDYPAAKMQVIAVNDGSDDGTQAEMNRAQTDFAGLSLIEFAKNRGKRHGMAAGARMATGEILIYVDSDSFVQPNAIQNMVAGFRDPLVGAVCGHANVENSRANWLTKMQEVRYFVAFRIVKAAESLFSAVTCCSGCLAAYRRSYLMEFLDIWLAQRFMGTEATFGDDRSLTNHMLRNWKVIYSSQAVCTTIVPEKWDIFFRQQLRWKKSWIRESLLAMKFMWKRNPFVGFFFYFGVLFPLISPIVVANALILPILHGKPMSFQYIFGTTLMATLFGLVYYARYRTRIWVYGILFSFFYMFVLVWQTYYALITLRKNHWGTR